MPLYFATNHKVYCGRVKEDANGVTTQFPFDPNVNQTVHVKEIIEGQTGYVKYQNTDGKLYCNEIIEQGLDLELLYDDFPFYYNNFYVGNYQNNGEFSDTIENGECEPNISNVSNVLIYIEWVIFDSTNGSEINRLNSEEFSIEVGQSTGQFSSEGNTTVGGGYIEFWIDNYNRLYWDVYVSQGSGDYVVIPYVTIYGQ